MNYYYYYYYFLSIFLFTSSSGAPVPAAIRSLASFAHSIACWILLSSLLLSSSTSSSSSSSLWSLLCLLLCLLCLLLLLLLSLTSPSTAINCFDIGIRCNKALAVEWLAFSLTCFFANRSLFVANLQSTALLMIECRFDYIYIYIFNI